MSRVFVAMSGGIDSSLSAALLKEEGYDVVGLFVAGWEDDFVGCQAKKDLEDVVSVCHVLSIPYYTIDLKKEFLKYVFDNFLEKLRQGLTPNPDISCNQHIKFRLLLERALAMGGEFLATGHYCRLIRDEFGRARLLKGSDVNKDQSYFLHAVDSTSLAKVTFPVGDLKKSEVRSIAKSVGLMNFAKKDSVGICFVENKKFREFISHYIPTKKGLIISSEGNIMGEHHGLHLFTIGQRKGLRIGGKGSAWFVARKDVDTNTLWVVQGFDHPWLFASCFRIQNVNWISQTPSFPFLCSVKVRYRSVEVSCRVILFLDEIEVILDTPVRAVTPGQSAVFYRGIECLGGGIIREIISDKHNY
ncbi:tRNA 2-thiouridine(34) synthase MnmA [Candidatus Similichlamydia epinepheli]|uniref:tRNA 2-thiouridine(34) synthase MnmA n=1 Tax=Candidatus Similichlamydia epinepheli TaxID=1903953 RepID=UPI000D351D61|nr:tRNA 2-thiouridine(34) synthase MnmA [Candidatus Similichlamydia epinepheli]